MQLLSNAEYKYPILPTLFFPSFFMSLFNFFPPFVLSLFSSFAFFSVRFPFFFHPSFLSIASSLLSFWGYIRTFDKLYFARFTLFNAIFKETKAILTSSNKVWTSRAKNVWPSVPHSLYVNAWFIGTGLADHLLGRNML